MVLDPNEISVFVQDKLSYEDHHLVLIKQL